MDSLIVSDQNLKGILESWIPSQFDILKDVFLYYRALGTLRKGAWIALGLSFGVMALVGLSLVLPATIIYPSNFVVAQTCFNVLAVIVCVWIFVQKRLIGFLLLAFALLLCGAWNLFTTFWGSVDLFKSILALFGLFQLGFAFQSYDVYQNLSSSEKSSDVLNSEAKQQYDSIWRTIVISKIGVNPEYVWLTLTPKRSVIKTFLVGNRSFVACVLLLSNGAVLAYRNQKLLEFIPKSNLIIEPAEGYSLSITITKPTVGKIRNNDSNVSMGIYARINDAIFTGYIYLKDFANYTVWKQFVAETITESIKTETFSNERQKFVTRQKRIKSAIVIYIAIAAILVIYVMQHLPK